MKVAAVCTPLWFLGNYLGCLALEKTVLTYVEVLTSTSTVFVLFLSAAFPMGSQDKISLTKFLVIFVNMAGVVTLAFSNINNRGDDVTTSETDATSLFGIVLSIASALIFAVYVVYFNRMAGSPDGSDDRVDIVLFFGTIGAMSAVFLLPLFPILHYSGLETFEWPDVTDWKYLVISALLGTAISDMLWLWSSLLTTSLIASLGNALTTPIALIVDIMVNRQTFPVQFFVGIVLILVSFVVLNVLSFVDYSDPVLRWSKSLHEIVKMRWGSNPQTDSEIKYSLLETFESPVLNSPPALNSPALSTTSIY